MKNGEKRAKYISIAVVILAFVLTIVLIYQFIHLGQLKAKEVELNNSLASLEEVIADYSKQKDYYSDRETYLDEYAHEVLNMSKDGETWYTADKN